MGNPVTWVKSANNAFRHFGIADGSKFLLSRLSSKLRAPGADQVLELRLRGNDKPVCIRAAEGDFYVLRQVLLEQEYADPAPAHSDAMRAFYDACCREERTPVIVDCGGNIGMAAIWYARLYPRAQIFSVEPVAENFRLLEMNAAPYPNITPVYAAISHQNKRVTLRNEEGDAPYAWQTIDATDGPVQAVTIGSLLDRVADCAPFIVKIDIEGFETDLFESALDWIEQSPLIVFESHDRLFPWRATADAIFRALIPRGRRDYLQQGESMFCYSHALLRKLERV